MDAHAVVLKEPGTLGLRRLDLVPEGTGDVLVDVEWSGISTGTERLLWSGRMPDFPGMGYPLVPGYETVGRVSDPGGSDLEEGDRVFVPGSRCWGDVRALFGGAAERLTVRPERVVRISDRWGEESVLLALAATARRAVIGGAPPDLIVGHGVLGRLMARMCVALGGTPTVWEHDPCRQAGAEGYAVLHPENDSTPTYERICDVSGDAGLIDTLVGRLAPGGEIVLAGFYGGRIGFDFAPAFMREARFRIAAEWRPENMAAVLELMRAGRLSLDGLVTHRSTPEAATDAYETAFEDPACLKMILDWRDGR